MARGGEGIVELNLDIATSERGAAGEVIRGARLVARRPPDDAPALDPEYKFGGVPTSAATGKTADEALIAIKEMAEAQERDAKRRAAALENLGRPTG